MGAPTERPVPEDSSPEQSAAHVQPRAPLPESTIDRQVGSPFGTERRGMFGVSGSGDTTGYGGLDRKPWVPPEAQRRQSEAAAAQNKLPRQRLIILCGRIEQGRKA